VAGKAAKKARAPGKPISSSHSSLQADKRKVLRSSLYLQPIHPTKDRALLAKLDTNTTPESDSPNPPSLIPRKRAHTISPPSAPIPGTPLVPSGFGGGTREEGSAERGVVEGGGAEGVWAAGGAG